jgi:hypothetical protein
VLSLIEQAMGKATYIGVDQEEGDDVDADEEAELALASE